MTEITEAMIERGARAICGMDTSTDTWELIEVPYIRWYNNAARACILAALEGDE